MLNSVACLYVGSIRSLNFYTMKRSGDDGIIQNTDNHLLSLKGAMSIPILSTMGLVAAYMAVINNFDILKYILEGYFLFVAILVLKKYLYPYSQMNAALKNWDNVTAVSLTSRYFQLKLTLLEVIVLGFSAYFVFIYVQTKFWVANNMISIAFTIYAIENWLVGNFKHIVIVFVGLIAYDTFFVFASEVMMTVAKEVDLPLKLLIPAWGGQFAMLGLGDIIIPGLLTSMCVRFDLITAFKLGKEKAIKDGVTDESKVAKYIQEEMVGVYFHQALIGYVLGLAITYMALSAFQTA